MRWLVIRIWRTLASPPNHLISKKWFGLPSSGRTSMPGIPGQVIIHFTGFIPKQTKVWWYCDCMPSPSIFLDSTWVTGNTTAEIRNVSRPEHIIWVWLWTIRPGAAATQGRWRIVCSPTPNRCLWGQWNIPGGNCTDEDSLANIIRWQVLDGWRGLEMNHCRLGSSLAIRWSFCRYTSGV